MKKILFLLLSTIAMYGQVPADATPLENIQITNNKTSTTATKVNVQENDGTINTKPLLELANYVEFASAVNLPVTGEQGKLYLTKDNNRLYRFNGTIYQELTTDISGKEDIANKQNSLAVDGTNTKYPTVTAVNAGLALKANLASPALTGTPTAPTPTTTTGIANKSYVDGLNSGNVKLTGNQTITGQKTFNNSTLLAAVVANNTSTGTGLSVVNSSAGTGIYSNNESTGKGIHSDNSSTGISIYSINYQSGNGIVSNQGPSGTGFNYVGQNNGTNTFTVNKLGATTAASFIKSSTPATNILLAGGGDIAQNTAFNKNFGTTAGTVAEGNDSRILNGQTAFGWGNHVNGGYAITTGSNINQASFRTALGLGSNAYTSTAYLPLTGGTLSGALNGTSANFTSMVTAKGGMNLVSNNVNEDNVSYTITNTAASKIYSFTTGKQGITHNGVGIWNRTDNTHPLWFEDNGAATFSSTVTATSYTATSLPVFENNAAASSLAVGQFYRTSIGVLMVKF